jgi:hypothetical protein
MLRLLLFLLAFAPVALIAQTKPAKASGPTTVITKKSTPAKAPAKSSTAADPSKSSPKTVKKLDAVSFLKEILGATYSKADKFWVLPRNAETKSLFESDAEGGLFVSVDTIVRREVGDRQEQWVLFVVEGYIFNFASLVKTDAGWQLKEMKYSLHQGAPGEYAPTDFNFAMISQKTFISIKEMWMNGDNITEKWLLFDPFSLKSAGNMPLSKESSTGDEDWPEQYNYFKTTDIAYKIDKAILPDVVLTQTVQDKVKDKKELRSTRKVRYVWNDKKSTYEKAK